MKKSIIIILAVVAILVIWVVSVYNGLVTMDENVSGQWANVETQYQRRADLIPNLVNTVKGYASHEKTTLNQVIEARNKAISAPIEDKSKYEGELSNALSKLLMLSENYPNLKADSQFLNLQEQLQTIESEIEKSRRYYNGAVRILNTSIQKVPTCIIASLFKFSKEPFFEIENDNERENIKVKF